MPRPSGLRVIVRPDTRALTIVGTVNGERIRRRAKSVRPEIARQEAAALEIKLLEASSDILVPEQVRSKLRELAHATAVILAVDPSARAFFQTVLRRSIARIEEENRKLPTD